jgi:hypothetical protein
LPTKIRRGRSEDSTIRFRDASLSNQTYRGTSMGWLMSWAKRMITSGNSGHI